ncbi:MAG: hypothetical protein HOP33_09870 [Verrucomicrobia bacterium]|nr:hypothetical protein [Verrucomicrobiota bacterium]
MKYPSLIRLTVVGFVMCASAKSSFGAVLYQDNFDAGTSAGAWTAVLSHADASANFAFDYGTVLGIPSAPNSGGSTIGMRFLANQSAGVQQGISASPNGQSFTGDFTIRFDMWLNYNGPVGNPGGLPGGSGSTQVGSFGWGTSGASAQWAGSSSSIMFGATGDGGSASDYRLYRNNALVAAGPAYAAGSLNNTAVYYTGLFGGQAAPAAQIGLFPGQTGVTDPGTLGFKWRDVVVQKTGTILTWSVDGNLIATGDSAAATLSGDNIFFGIFDINASSSTDVNDHLITAVYDNIVVTQVPEPTAALLGGVGLSMMIGSLRRRRS